MYEKLFPREKKWKTYNPHLERPWHLDCSLIYDQGNSKWSKGYRTRFGAKWCAWWHYHLFSYGGEIVLRKVNNDDR
jgi:hypothetical protein